MERVDYRGLTTPVSADEVRAFRRANRTKPEYAGPSRAVGVIVVVVAVIVAGIAASSIVGVLIDGASSVANDPLTLIVSLALPIGFMVVLAVIVVAVARGSLGGGNWARWLRLNRFATDNALTFSPSSPNPAYPGAIFTLGRSRVALDHLRTTTERFIDYGNYRFVTGSGRSSTTHNWGFVALSLDRALPHMVLDSRANNGLFGTTNLPAAFTKSQILELEGDFNEFFTLYCPREYERDALYIFTPDLMALLIDEAAPFDVEIIDTWMFVYSSRTFDLEAPAVHQRLWRITETVGHKAVSQTERYADERVGDYSANLVAPQGRRLARGIPVVTVVIGVAAILFWAWPFVADVVGTIVGR